MNFEYLVALGEQLSGAIGMDPEPASNPSVPPLEGSVILEGLPEAVMALLSGTPVTWGLEAPGTAEPTPGTAEPTPGTAEPAPATDEQAPATDEQAPLINFWPFWALLLTGSTMTGPGRVTDPIENALGDSALRQGRV